MAPKAFTPLPLIYHSRLSNSRISGSVRSRSSLHSTSSGESEPTEPRIPESLFSSDSAWFGSTLSLTLTSVKSTETLNYDGTERMSASVIPVAQVSEEKSAILATKNQVDELTTAYPLPQVAEGKWQERWSSFRYKTMSAYMRLWALIILTNVAIIIAMTRQHVVDPGAFTYGYASTATGANLLIAALARQEHCINLVFRLATSLPHRTPLAIRRRAAKVYSYGGVHAGCGISALLWYVVYAWLSVDQFQGTHAETIGMAATAALTLLCLFVIIGMAHPKIRIRWHDQWEFSHRFAGWTAIGLVWAQTMIMAMAFAHRTGWSFALIMVETPTFWFLIIITCCLIYPWLRLRRRKVEPEVLSSHAVRLWFGGKTMPSCVGARLSHRPLTENHGFATIPNATPSPSELESGLARPEEAHTRRSSSSPRPTAPCSTKSESSTISTPNSSTTTATGLLPTQPAPTHGKGYSILVSRAGDFTSSLIDNPPTHLWTRGAPTRGVLDVAKLFSPLIVIATGSGIGPCLSFLQVYPDYPMRVIWCARSPRETYGEEVVGAVLRADPKAIVMDSRDEGMQRPDLGAVGYALARETGAEAVVIISNPASTRKVVFALESRGVPAFGAIFDS